MDKCGAHVYPKKIKKKRRKKHFDIITGKLNMKNN